MTNYPAWTSAFHLQISQVSGNDIANEIINHIIPSFQESNRAVIYLYRKALLMESEHREILEAIRTHDRRLPKPTCAAISNAFARIFWK